MQRRRVLGFIWGARVAVAADVFEPSSDVDLLIRQAGRRH